ncbi:RluA family pseudouridine synthase [Spirochaetia bacterium 38H-sp]|uniref:RluA family pseudouridine synthase n=1 Tax=Rarispira pelagica TaxID=3141764 RepID=A0ABU9UAC4_9SPIR
MDKDIFMEFTAGEDDEGKRLDRLLRTLLKDASLSLVYSAIRKGHIRLDGKKVPQNTRVHTGNVISIKRNLKDTIKKKTENLRTQYVIKPDDILMENRHLLAINKHPGIPTHGKGSLTDSVRSYLSGKLSDSLAFSPSPLHRLDKISSGIVVFSSSIDGARWFTRMMRERRFLKYYLALMEGCAKKVETWTDNLEKDFKGVRKKETGKKAITHVTPIVNGKDLSLVVCRIETGLTHQIRVQAALHSHVLAGDKRYGSRLEIKPFLHAFFLKPQEDSSFLPAEGITAQPHTESRSILDKFLPDWEKAFYDFLSSISQ